MLPSPCPCPAWPLPQPQFGNVGSSRSNSYHDFLSPFPFPGSIAFPRQLWRCRGCVYRQLKLINCTQEETEAPRQYGRGESRRGQSQSRPCLAHAEGSASPEVTMGDVCGCSDGCHLLSTTLGTSPRAQSDASTKLRGKGGKQLLLQGVPTPYSPLQPSPVLGG